MNVNVVFSLIFVPSNFCLQKDITLLMEKKVRFETGQIIGKIEKNRFLGNQFRTFIIIINRQIKMEVFIRKILLY